MDRRTVLKGLGGAAGVGVAAGAGGVVGRVSAVDAGSASEREARGLAAAATGQVGFYGGIRVVWSVETTQRLAALTFDDGPDPDLTPQVLDVLARHQVTSTFCCMGWNVQRHPDLFAQVVDAGHEIGNHGWSHRDLAQFPAAMAAAEIRRSHELLTERSGKPPRWYRPPRGELTGSAVRVAGELGCDVLLWSFYGGPAGQNTPAEVQANVLRNLLPGAIVDFHDGIGRDTFHRGGSGARAQLARRRTEVQALDAILREGKQAGYRFVTAGKLVGSETPQTPAG